MMIFFLKIERGETKVDPDRRVNGIVCVSMEKAKRFYYVSMDEKRGTERENEIWNDFSDHGKNAYSKSGRVRKNAHAYGIAGDKMVNVNKNARNSDENFDHVNDYENESRVEPKYFGPFQKWTPQTIEYFRCGS